MRTCMGLHFFTVRAFDKQYRYVCHSYHLTGRVSVSAWKREAKRTHPEVACFRVYNETLGKEVESIPMQAEFHLTPERPFIP